MEKNLSSYTQIAEDKLFSLSEICEDNPLDKELIAFIREINDKNIFAEKLLCRLRKLGYKGDENDISSIEKYVLTFIDSTEGINKSDFRMNIKDWLTDTVPAGDEKRRKKMYMLCFALKMSADETASFFREAYFEKPFNFRSVEETVYFYCLSRQLKYTEAIRIIKTIEEKSIFESKGEMVKTGQIRKDIETISNEVDLIDYCIRNRCYFEGKNITAKKLVADLVEVCKKKAIREHNKDVEEASKYTEESEEREEEEKTDIWKNISLRRLLGCIYGLDIRISKSTRSTIVKGIKNFPSKICKNLPQEQQIRNILDVRGKREASNDSIRKTLILLLFYDYYSEEREDEGADSFEDFLAEINTELTHCGYQEIYLRNPYDWLFAFCAVQEKPIEALRTITEKVIKGNN